MAESPPTAAGASASINSNAADHPIYVDGFQGTPAEIERQWYEKVYVGRGDRMAQLTLRAVLMGTVLGGILSLTNLYIGLKAGWGFGVAITACIVSYATWNALLKLRLARTPMTILENNCMQSTASAAGYSTGATLVSAFSAYVMINNQSMPFWQMMAWVFVLAVLGVTMAIPMKRQMINTEQLRFPTGTASAVTLQTLYSEGKKAAKSARALTIGAVAAAISQFWMDGLQLISAKLAPFTLGALVERANTAVIGPVWMGRTVFFVWDPIFIAGGALMGLRAGASMLLGGTLCWAVFVPIMQANGTITGSSFREIVQWTLWGGVSCMVTSGILAFALQWRSIVAAMGSMGRMFRRGRNVSAAESVMERIETPMSWFFIGQGLALIAVCWLGKVTLGLPVWESALAVIITFFLALVACRVTGETDTTPIGAMGKVTQLLFGALNPGNMNINLMSANITSSAAMASADLLTDLKSGYLLGANPRKQFLAQFAGIFMGTLASVAAFRVLVPNAAALGGDQFPAPAAQAWRAVAVALSKGLDALEPVKLWSIAIGGAVGILLVLLPRWFPKQQNWIPSPAAMGLAWTFHWYYGMLFCLGAVIARLLEKKNPKLSEAYTWPVASGIIAGGSLMGVLIIFWENGPEMLRQFLGG